MSAVRHWGFHRRKDGRFGSGVPHLDGKCPVCDDWAPDELAGRALSDEAVWVLCAIAAAVAIALAVTFW
jgi:hypothetical protein